jgi:hypothetical protein
MCRELLSKVRYLAAMTTKQKNTYKMCGELSLVVPGSNDDALAGVGGETGQRDGAAFAAAVVHLKNTFYKIRK